MPNLTQADAILTPTQSGDDEASLLDILDHVLSGGIVLWPPYSFAEMQCIAMPRIALYDHKL